MLCKAYLTNFPKDLVNRFPGRLNFRSSDCEWNTSLCGLPSLCYLMKANYSTNSEMFNQMLSRAFSGFRQRKFAFLQGQISTIVLLSLLTQHLRVFFLNSVNKNSLWSPEKFSWSYTRRDFLYYGCIRFSSVELITLRYLFTLLFGHLLIFKV